MTDPASVSPEDRRRCVLHHATPAVLVYVLWPTRGLVRDFCADCIESGEDDCNFGRCYLCDHGDHAHCIGVPCQCECDGPDNLGRLDNAIADARAQLAALEAKREAVVRA